MSKLEELIQQYCPDGVEWKTLGELGSFYGGLSGKTKEDFKDGNAKFISYKNIYANPSININTDERVKIAEGEKQHTIQYGDTLTRIAQRFGVSVEQIVELNNIQNPNVIYAGERIKI